VGATPRWTTFRWLGVHVAWVATEPTWSGCHRLAVVGTDGVARAATVRWLGGSVSP
jgi:hypothetical protein